ncbi:protein-export membrane protein SecG [Rodentibacter pneumotropicus]|uniref:Protein-export membrane protein SecG n=2 Tax=Rodentibacter pneumotropicus TaxID=758 RepID=A0A448MLT6_9PAST|nr:protein-export membrane protein SecG [Rodentibacter pneumotropicus]
MFILFAPVFLRNTQFRVEKMYQVLLFIYVVVAIALIGFILVQQGKGANAGASFGGGASGTMFGSAGAGNFLTRTSAILATAFFVIALVLGNLNSHRANVEKGAFDDLSKTAEQVQQQLSSPAVENKNNDIPQ